MPRVAAAGKTAALPTTVRGPSLYATTAVRLNVRSVEVFNVGTAAVEVALVRASATGTQGTALTEVNLSDDSHAIIGTGFNTHTADATVGAPVRYAVLGAAAGAGVIWTWEFGAFVIDNVATQGAVLICPAGTAQHLTFTYEWDE